jgi:hypothetical protein
VGALLAAAALAPRGLAADGKKVNITVSKETTYLTGPVRPDGTVDYLAALEARLSKGVTPEDNAAVALLEAFGPSLSPERARERAWAKLGVPAPDEKGSYFIALDDFVASRAPEIMREQLGRKAEAELDEALKGPWRREECPLVAAWLAVNERPLAKIAAAAKRSRYYWPFLTLTPKGKRRLMINLVLPKLAACRYAGKALAARSMRRLGAGDVKGAWSDALTMHGLARRICQGPTLIERLVAIAVDAYACRAGAALATSGNLTGPQARAILAEMEKLPPLPPVVEAIKVERLFMLDSIAFCASLGTSRFDEFAGTLAEMQGERAQEREGPFRRLPDADLDWDLMLRAANRWYDRFEAAMAKETFAERQKALKEFDKALDELNVGVPARLGGPLGLVLLLRRAQEDPAKYRRPVSRVVGDMLISILMPALGRVNVLDNRSRTDEDLSKVAMALAAFRAEKGKYPSKLAELAPASLKAVPKDRFTERPLLYKPRGEGFILYSVGENAADDGGRDRDAGGDDQVVKTK